MTIPTNSGTADLPCPWIETPLLSSPELSKVAGCNVYLKLENLQPSGSFKSRGVGNYLVSHLRSAPASADVHFYIPSGGNAGLACVGAATTLGVSATVVVPMSTSAYMIGKLWDAGAKEVVQQGASYAEAEAYLQEVLMPQAVGRGETPVFVPPFDAQPVWDGNSTMVPEIQRQLQRTVPASAGKPDLVICSVGGGGLFNGVIQGLEACGMHDVPVLAVETNGADSFAQSMHKKELVTLPAITSVATSLGARTISAKTLEYGMNRNVKNLVLEDKDAVEGCIFAADKHRFLVEAACGVNIAACSSGRLHKLFPHLHQRSNVVVVFCGGSNITFDLLKKYQTEYC